jgi:starvation-inducible DNA-binding protein
MHTRIDIPEVIRAQVGALLNASLADAIDLHSQAKQAHWNVRGPRFAMLHALFDDLAEQAEEFADLLAERALQLGVTAQGTLRHAARASRLEEITSTHDEGLLVRHLSASLARFAASVRSASDASAKLGDATSADVFTEVSRGADKLLWMVSSHEAG